jgi:predicted esterase
MPVFYLRAFIVFLLLSIRVNGFDSPHSPKYILLLPDNYDSTKTYPLFVALHGNGGDAAGFSNLFKVFKNLPVIFALPQGQFARLDGGYSWYFETNDREMWESTDFLASDLVYETILDVKAKFKISDVYLFGFSQGASVAYMTGFKHPVGITGIAAVGGGLPAIDVKGSVVKLENLTNALKIKILVARGLDDPYARRTGYDYQVKFLKEKNFAVKDFQYTGKHEITYELMDKVFEWMGVK